MDNTVDGVPSDLEEPLAIEVRDEDAETILVLQGELDPHTAPELRAHIDQALARDRTHLVLDLAALSFIDSSGLRVILAAHKETRDRGGSFFLRSPSPTAQRLLDITGLLDHIEIRG